MKDGTTVFYVEDGEIYSGIVTDIESVQDGFEFSIASYGTCEGNYRISSRQIGRTVFLTEEDAERFR